MDVSHSVEFVFSPVAPRGLMVGDPRESPASQNLCSICGLSFERKEALLDHLRAPVRPHSAVTAHAQYVDAESGRSFATHYALNTFKRQRRQQQQQKGKRAGQHRRAGEQPRQAGQAGQAGGSTLRRLQRA